MDLRIPYRHFDFIFNDEECERILEKGKSILKLQSRDQSSGKIYSDDSVQKTDAKVRNCEVCWLNEHWIYERIHEIVNVANQNAGWNWQIDCVERLQFTKYDVGGHYSWHTDGGSDHHSVYTGSRVHDWTGKVRKISVTVNLSSANDYNGGELMFFNPTYLSAYSEKIGESKTYTPKEVCDRGSAIVFPSFTPHKVSPITMGTRYSLVAWFLGQPWK